MRTLRILGLAVGAVMILAGCSRAKPEPESSPAPTPAPESISILVPSDTQPDLTSPVLEALQERFGVRISVSACDPTQYTGRLQIALTSNEAFDLIETSPVLANAYRSRLQNAQPILTEYAPHYLESITEFGLWEDVDHRLSCVPTRIVDRRSDIVWFIRKDQPVVPALSEWQSVSGDEIGLSIPGGTEGLMTALSPLWGSSWTMEEDGCGYVSDGALLAAQAAGVLSARGILDPNQAVRTRRSWQQSIRDGKVILTAAGREAWDLLLQSGYRMTAPPAWGEAAALPAPSHAAQQWCSIPNASKNPAGVARLLENCFSAAGEELLNYGLEGVHFDRILLEDGTAATMPRAPFDAEGIWQAAAQGLTPPVIPGHIWAEDLWLSPEESAEYAVATARVLAPAAVMTPRNPSSAQRAAELDTALLRERQLFVEAVITQGNCSAGLWQQYLDALDAAGLPEAMRFYGVTP